MISFWPCYFQSICLCIYWLLLCLQTDLSCFTEHVAEVTIPGPTLHHHIFKPQTRLWIGPNLGPVSIHHPIHCICPPAPVPIHFWERDPLGKRYDNGKGEIVMPRTINRKKSPDALSLISSAWSKANSGLPYHLKNPTSKAEKLRVSNHDLCQVLRFHPRSSPHSLIYSGLFHYGCVCISVWHLLPSQSGGDHISGGASSCGWSCLCVIIAFHHASAAHELIYMLDGCVYSKPASQWA